jgi:hypothetical protein
VKPLFASFTGMPPTVETPAYCRIAAHSSVFPIRNKVDSSYALDFPCLSRAARTLKWSNVLMWGDH